MFITTSPSSDNKTLFSAILPACPIRRFLSNQLVVVPVILMTVLIRHVDVSLTKSVSATTTASVTTRATASQQLLCLSVCSLTWHVASVNNCRPIHRRRTSTTVIIVFVVVVVALAYRTPLISLLYHIACGLMNLGRAASRQCHRIRLPDTLCRRRQATVAARRPN